MRRRTILLSGIACSALTQLPAHAAEDASAPTPQAQRSGQGIDEIIVTARKRQESVLKVPVVENVVTADTLQQAQITNIQGLTTKVPGLLIGGNVGSVGAQLSLRGIGTGALNAGVDSSVSLNIDGQQFSQGLALRSGLFDLQQAEVLKGPQALFFGKNSPGGVIALTTADPGDHAEVIARHSYEWEARENRTEVILSGPVTEQLGLRFAGQYADSDGFFHNIAEAVPGQGGADPAHRRYGGRKGYVLRGTAVWKPTDELRVRFKANATKDEGDPPQLQNVSCPGGIGPSVLGLQFIGGGAKACKEDRNYELVDMDPAAYPARRQDGSLGIRNDGVPFDDIRQHFEVLDINWDFTPGISLSSTSTYYHNKTDDSFNGVMAGAAGPVLFADNHFTRSDFTQELRLQSDTQAPLNWLFGGFYQDGSMKNGIFIPTNQALGLPLPPTLAAGSHDVDISSWSLFGQLRWSPIQTLELAAGVRYTDEDREDKAISLDAFVTRTYNEIALPQPKITSKNWSPELTATFTPTDTFTLFGALKQGYKSGSYDITTPATPGKDNSFGDEKVRGGEVGIKTRLLDRALSFDIAAYYYKYDGLQVGVSQPSDTNGVPVIITLNAGKARTYGIDSDSTYRFAAVPGLAANLAVNWNKAKYLSLHGVPCYGGQTIARGCAEVPNPAVLDPDTGLPVFTGADYSGTVMERAPEWQLTGGVDYDFNVSDRLAMSVGASMQYSTKYKAVIGDRADFFQDSYTKFNGYFTVKDPDESWELSLIGNNITNKIRASYCANSDFQNSTVLTAAAQRSGTVNNLPGDKIDDVACSVDPGRQVFLKLTVRPLSWMK